MRALAGLSLALAAVGQVSAQPNGNEANGESLYPPMSYDGRYVAFYSKASNLVASDENRAGDIFVRDRERHITELISVTPEGRAGNGESTWPTISGNGRFVVFTSRASDLVPNDTNGMGDIFVYDREGRSTERVSVSSVGEEARGESYTYFPSISYDGRFITFLSEAGNLVSGDENEDWDVFVRDREANVTAKASAAIDGRDTNGPSLHAVISGDGRVVAFNSTATNLVEGDRNGMEDVFAVEWREGTTRRVSRGVDGSESESSSDRASISYNGSRIAFSSLSANLVDGDINGQEDVFLYDARTDKIQLVSVSSNGTPMADTDDVPLCCFISPACCIVVIITDRKSVLSPDGNTVVFRSDAPNLSLIDFNSTVDIFAHNVSARTTERVSVSSRSAESNGPSIHHGVSIDGRFIAFSSEASNLVARDNNGVSDIFVRDRATGITERVSVPSDQ